MKKISPNIAFFLRFLKEKNCSKKFFYNVFVLKHRTFHEWIVQANKRYSSTEPLSGLIRGAFLWCETKEGYDYWGALSDELYVRYNSQEYDEYIKNCKKIQIHA